MKPAANVIFFVVFQVAINSHLSFSQSQNSNFQFNFDGYVRQNNNFLMKSCPRNDKENEDQTKKMIIESLLRKDAVESPTNNKDKIHLKCVPDPLMGNVVNFTIYKDDNDKTGKGDRQRMEMKGKEDGKKGTSFIFAWWFKLDPKMKNAYGGKDEFFHIFQIKTEGSDSLKINPLATLSLSEKDQFHLRLNNLTSYGNKPLTLLKLKDAKGKWIQVFVEAVFKESGYIRVMLKDDKGKDLIKGRKVAHEMWWNGANFKPKWGLYRHKVQNVYQPADWQLFQNVQIWKKK